MNESYEVLLVDDHQIILDTFSQAFDFIFRENSKLKIDIKQAKSCKSAWQKVCSMTSHETIKIFLLEIKLPPDPKTKLFSGEDLGIKIREYFPKAKILICTSITQNYKLHNILKSINPDALIVKRDIDFNDLLTAIKKVLKNENYYSKTVINFLRKRIVSTFILDTYDMQILFEISNGSKMKEMQELIPLSKTAIEKRKRKLKFYFNVDTDSDRELVEAARENGFL